MSIGTLVGSVVSLLSATLWQNKFISVSGPGFGVYIGLLIADIIWCLKRHKENQHKITKQIDL